jgi:hypothetical protein
VQAGDKRYVMLKVQAVKKEDIATTTPAKIVQYLKDFGKATTRELLG